MNSGPAALWVEALRHRYPGADRDALAEVGLRIDAGERVGLLGPNGAGKSTLMRLCCGFLPIESGPGTRVELAGHDLRTQSRAARASVGYMPEHVPLYTELRASEHLGFRARVKGVARRRRAAEVQRVAEATGIADVLRTPIGQLSRGYRQRVGVADALLGAPPVVILDEPTVGLDPNQVREIRGMLRDLGGAHTLVFSSHILAEVELLCDRVVILDRGRVVADETLADATAGHFVVVRWHGAVAEARAVVGSAFAAVGAEASDAVLDSVIADDDESARARARLALPAGVAIGDALAAIGRASLDAGLVLCELRPGGTRLEERFAALTTDADAEASP